MKRIILTMTLIFTMIIPLGCSILHLFKDTSNNEQFALSITLQPRETTSGIPAVTPASTLDATKPLTGESWTLEELPVDNPAEDDSWELEELPVDNPAEDDSWELEELPSDNHAKDDSWELEELPTDNSTDETFPKGDS